MCLSCCSCTLILPKITRLFFFFCEQFLPAPVVFTNGDYSNLNFFIFLSNRKPFQQFPVKYKTYVVRTPRIIDWSIGQRRNYKQTRPNQSHQEQSPKKYTKDLLDAIKHRSCQQFKTGFCAMKFVKLQEDITQMLLIQSIMVPSWVTMHSNNII